MAIRYAILAVAAALTCTACGPDPVPYEPYDQPAFSLSVWLDPAKPLLDPSDSLDGCSKWLAKGVVCRIVETQAEADVKVWTNDEPCEKDEKGNYTLAVAYGNGNIVFNSLCLGKPGDYNRHRFRAVMTHELGHTVGIWEHVPNDCDDEHLTHPSGQPICGVAVMNPMIDDDVYFVTVIDALAFDVRDEEMCRLHPLPTSAKRMALITSSSPICTFRSR